MNYKKTYVPHNGYTPLCTIGECSLQIWNLALLN